MAEQYNFQSKNFLPNLNTDKWSLEKAVLNSDYTVSISPGGLISCSVEDVIGKTFSMYKTELDVSCAGINNDSNFNSNAGIAMDAVYTNSNNEVDYTQNEIMGINTFDVVDVPTNRYKDTNIFSSANKRVVFINFVIFNFTNEVMKVNSAKMFISEDINKEQLSNSINDILSGSLARRLDFYRDINGGILGMDVSTDNNKDIYAFRFLGGQLVRVQTNFGYDLVIGYKTVGEVLPEE